MATSKVFLLPVTRTSLPFAASLLRFSAGNLPSTTRFLICARSRELERQLRVQFAPVLAAHAFDSVPDWRQSRDLLEAFNVCDGVLLASGGGNSVTELDCGRSASEWFECEQLVTKALSQDHQVVKLSWTLGFTNERSPLSVGRANWELEETLKQQIRGDKLQIVRAATGMDTFLQGRMFDMVCARTLSMSVNRGRMAFVHPLDVAESLSALLQKEGEDGGVHTLTGPEALTFQDVATLLSEGIADKVRYSHFPLWAVQPARWVHGVPGDAIEEELAVVRALEAGAQQEVDTGLIEKLLGRQPRTFRNFVAENKKAWPRTDPL
ncbi:hypothetical protein PHYBOEH_001228 [Phytophthora boehmeriae]|uniref:NAD(P)-binding domain-containing protein n=1 Tax=Phytophthora boehmeriae TaxID=109152 RepID=A0A8T1WZJ5_9STRA|nr:hypothetical protein PHYBOEH_001228 [Phytophthora boehmeriae]